MLYRIGQSLRIEFYKYPEQRLHYWWEATVHQVHPDAVMVYMPVGFTFHHVSKGRSFTVNHQAYVVFWQHKWYSGGPDLDAQGHVLEYYWNFQTPPQFEAERIWQYDLEVDLKTQANHQSQLFDLEEFEAKRAVYPSDWVNAVETAIPELQNHIAQQGWPVRAAQNPQGWLERG